MSFRRTAWAFALTVAFAQAASAHDPIIPRDLAAEAAGDLSAAAGAIALLSIGVFFGLDKSVEFLVRQRRFYVGFWAGKVYSGIATLGIAFVLWYCGVSMPFAAAARAAALASSRHVDKAVHGGQMAAIGDNHLEAVLRGDRSLTLYVQGITPKIAYPIPADTVWAEVASGTEPSTRVLLHPAPVAGERKGQSSVFAGEVPLSLAGKPVDLKATVPLGGSDHAVSFRFAAPPAIGPAIAGPALPGSAGSDMAATPAHDTSATKVVAMPVTPEQAALFLKPGGAYTAADIAANGSTTPDQKFGGMMANHHANPKKGSIICPVTLTLANPKFPWQVGGKKYLFCCPPCVAEFVKEAKANPKGLKGPETFVQK